MSHIPSTPLTKFVLLGNSEMGFRVFRVHLDQDQRLRFTGNAYVHDLHRRGMFDLDGLACSYQLVCDHLGSPNERIAAKWHYIEFHTLIMYSVDGLLELFQELEVFPHRAEDIEALEDETFVELAQREGVIVAPHTDCVMLRGEPWYRGLIAYNPELAEKPNA